MYFGLEVIQEYACGGENVFCEAGPAMVREFLHGDPARYPEAVAMVTYDLMPTEVPYGEPPAPPTSVNPQVYHYLHDVLGSVIGVVNETGTLVERYTLDAGERLCRSPRAGRTRSIRRRVKGTTYDPYGRPFIEKWDAAANEGSSAWVESASECGTGVPACGQMPYSPTGNPFMWTGHRYDAAVGLYHAHFRFYDPTLGRWLQRDPIEYKGGSINLYEYVRSAPLILIDPNGLAPRPVPGPPTGLPGPFGPPPVEVPGSPGNGWKWNPDPGNPRGGTWGPKTPVPGRGQPTGSWDPKGGHWDVDDGLGNPRDHYDKDGKRLTPEEAHGRDPKQCPNEEKPEPKEMTTTDKIRIIAIVTADVTIETAKKGAKALGESIKNIYINTSDKVKSAILNSKPLPPPPIPVPLPIPVPSLGL